MFKLLVVTFFGLLILFVVGFIILCSGIKLVRGKNPTGEEDPSPTLKLQLEDAERFDPR
jgi:hypothetical protein